MSNLRYTAHIRCVEQLSRHRPPCTPNTLYVPSSCNLDVAAAVPAAAVRPLDLALLATDPEEAHQRRDEPDDGRQEREGDDGLELAARVAAERDVAPVERGAAGRVVKLLR